MLYRVRLQLYKGLGFEPMFDPKRRVEKMLVRECAFFIPLSFCPPLSCPKAVPLAIFIRSTFLLGSRTLIIPSCYGSLSTLEPHRTSTGFPLSCLYTFPSCSILTFSCLLLIAYPTHDMLFERVQPAHQDRRDRKHCMEPLRRL